MSDMYSPSSLRHPSPHVPRHPHFLRYFPAAVLSLAGLFLLVLPFCPEVVANQLHISRHLATKPTTSALSQQSHWYPVTTIPVAVSYERRFQTLRHASKPDGDPNSDTNTGFDWEALGASLGTSTIFYITIGALAAAAIVKYSADSAAVVLTLAGLPVVGLTILKNLPVGASLRAKLDETLPQMEEAVAVRLREQTVALQSNPYYGPNRIGRLFNPPAHLNGMFPGDAGFDPLSLGKSDDPVAPLDTLDDCRQLMERRRVTLGLEAAPGAMDCRTKMERLLDYEVLHGRWAMLAVVGCLVPELLQYFWGDIFQFGETVWWKVGASKLGEEAAQLDYLGIPGLRIAGAQGLAIIAGCQFFLMGGPEYARYVGLRGLEPVGVFLDGTDATYPGGALFDPLGLSNDPNEFHTQRVVEVKHCRLAMVAMLGFAVQALFTQEGPVQNLVDFVADPSKHNVFALLSHSS